MPPTTASTISGDSWAGASTATRIYFLLGRPQCDLWRNGEEIHYEGRFFTEETLREAKEFIRRGSQAALLPLLGGQHPALPHAQTKEKWLDYYAGLPDPRRMYAAFVSRSTTTWAIAFLVTKGLTLARSRPSTVDCNR